MRGHAVLPNPDDFLKRDMVERMQLAGSDSYQALLVPDAAIVTDGARRVIFVVDAQGTVAAKAVELGPPVGDLRVIRGGVAARQPGDHQRSAARYSRPDGAAAEGCDPGGG